MADLCLIVVVNRQRCIVQRSEQISLDIEDIRGVVVDAVQNVLDMLVFQLHKPAFYDLRRSVFSGNKKDVYLNPRRETNKRLIACTCYSIFNQRLQLG